MTISVVHSINDTSNYEFNTVEDKKQEIDKDKEESSFSSINDTNADLSNLLNIPLFDELILIFVVWVALEQTKLMFNIGGKIWEN